MRTLLTVIFCFMLTTSSFGQEIKSFRENPEVAKHIATLSTCKIIYFNLALYLSIAENINVMFDETSENKNIIPAKDSIVENFRKLTQLQINEGNRLLSEGYNPYEIDYIVENSENQIVKLLSLSLSQMIEQPDQLKPMIEHMIEQTDGCDEHIIDR